MKQRYFVFENDIFAKKLNYILLLSCACGREIKDADATSQKTKYNIKRQYPFDQFDDSVYGLRFYNKLFEVYPQGKWFNVLEITPHSVTVFKTTGLP